MVEKSKLDSSRNYVGDTILLSDIVLLNFEFFKWPPPATAHPWSLPNWLSAIFLLGAHKGIIPFVPNFQKPIKDVGTLREAGSMIGKVMG